MISCGLAPRQRALYAAIRDQIPLADLLSGGWLSEKKAQALMNLVIQLRKVCNHPELFERRPPTAPYLFARPLPTPSCATTAATAAAAAAAGAPASASAAAAGTAPVVRAPGAAAVEIQLRIPRLLWRDGMRRLPSHASGAARGSLPALADAGGLLSVWRAGAIADGVGLREPAVTGAHAVSLDGRAERSGGAAWAFTRLCDLAPSQAALLGALSDDPLARWLAHRAWTRDGRCPWQGVTPARPLAPPRGSRHRPVACFALLLPLRLAGLAAIQEAGPAHDAALPPLLVPLTSRLLGAAPLLRCVGAATPPRVTAPPPALVCACSSSVAAQAAL